jgi:RNA polymerase sigma-70 factor (ECF subfamily)
MRAYLAKLLSNSSSTDDVLQEANKVIWMKRSHWDPETPFLKWAYRICYFQAKAYLRDLGRERLVFREDLLDLLAEDHPREDAVALREKALSSCLQRLDPKDRQLVLRHYHPEESLSSMAEDFGVSANTLSQRLRRLRIRLHQCVQNSFASLTP